MKFTVFDIEADNLLDDVSKIHCLSFAVYENSTFLYRSSITDLNQIKTFVETQEYLVGHNIVQYDIPVLEKLLGLEIQGKLIDTLGLSFYLYPHRKSHGLEQYGIEFNVPKVEVNDWQNLTIEEYIHRCEEDVKINSILFLKQFRYLIDIYGNLDKVLNFVSYLTFKLDCLKEQSEIGIPLNIPLIHKHIESISKEFDAKTTALSNAMPKELGRTIKEKPQRMFKKDGSLSSYGVKWVELIESLNLPPGTEIIREEPNPGSSDQLKEWLFSLGWKPITFKESKATKKMLPQVSLPFGGGICPSIKDMYEEYSILEELEGYYMLRHRLGILNSYLETERDGKVRATAFGFTKTLRMQHSRPIVNLPKPSVPFGREVREVLTIPDDSYVMIGNDVKGLEDNTKQHYLYFFDPKYVKEMQVEGFDPHIDIGVLAGLITKEEAKFYSKIEALSEEEKENLSKEDKDLYKSIKKKRGVAKTANFAATYGAGVAKIAETAKISIEEAQNLSDTYWKRNWAIKEVANKAITKIVPYTEFFKRKVKIGEDEFGQPVFEYKYIETNRSQLWIQNPLSGFWLLLTDEKDKFSAINQNTGVFLFDNYLQNVRQAFKPHGLKVCLQYHDETAMYCKKEQQELVTKILLESMGKVNKQFNLNVTLRIDIEYGDNYAIVH